MSKLVIILAALLGAAGCGYHVAGKADLMPATIKTIAIPPFGNNTIRYKLARQLPTDLEREFISRTRYKIVTDPNAATGRATAVQASAFMKITLTERATGKVLFSRPSIEYRERYEISENPQTFFDESSAGLGRMSKDVSHDVVTTILENF
jgi:hypothetical protein